MITYLEALHKCIDLSHEISPGIETVDISKSIGRILAENIITDIPSPSFRTSIMDGIAVRYEVGVTEWTISGIIGAGREISSALTANGSAVEIMTGSKVPDFADTVIPLEDYMIEGDLCKLNQNANIKLGMNIRQVGCEKQSGEIAVHEGKLITPKIISVLAACGKKMVAVKRKIKVGILTTGDELVDIDIPLADGKIRSTNSYYLRSTLSQFGCDVVDFGTFSDDVAVLTKNIEKALNSDIDLLITSGAVSKGRYDYLPAVFISCGIEKVFHGVRIKPGKPIFVGKSKSEESSKIIFGLPGNPVSVAVNFEIFVKPLLCVLSNLNNADSFTAKMKTGFSKADNKRHFVRAKVLNEGGDVLVEPFTKQSSANLFEYSEADCLIIIDEDTNKLSAGTSVKCLRIS